MGTAVRTPLSQSETLLHQRTAMEDTAQRGGGDSASNPTDLTPTGNWPYSPDSASWLAIEYDARRLQPDSPTWLYGGSTARPAFVVVKMYKYDLQRCPLMASESISNPSPTLILTRLPTEPPPPQQQQCVSPPSPSPPSSASLPPPRPPPARKPRPLPFPPAV